MYDYLTKVAINRPLTEEEQSRRLDIHKPAASEANDKHVVFRINDVYLDVAATSYQQVGWATLAFLLGFPAFAFLGWQFSLFAQIASVFWFLVAPSAIGCFFVRQSYSRIALTTDTKR